MGAPVHEHLGLRERVSHLCDRLANASAEGDDSRKGEWDAGLPLLDGRERDVEIFPVPSAVEKPAAQTDAVRDEV